MGETSISHKEEALEEIMSAEAYRSFEQMALYELNKTFMTRTCVDPDRFSHNDLDKLEQDVLDPNELEEPISDSDPEYVEGCEPQVRIEGPTHDQESSGMCEPQMGGFRIGLCCPMSNDIDRVRRFPQDRIFFARCGRYSLIGLVDSHGVSRTGEKLAKLIAEEMPRAIFKSPWLVREDDPVAALSSAFHRLHRKALKTLDLSLTGASCTAMLVASDYIWIANVGECKVLLGVPDDKDNAEAYHFAPVALTEDHKLASEAEFDRCMNFGGDVRRLVNDNVHRLFLKDKDLPGITITRAIGNRMAHAVGLNHIPSLTCVRREDIKEGSFLVLASGGVWATMSERAAVNWVGKYFNDPAQAAECLCQEAQKR